MNSNYKLVYSEALNTWVAVAEHVSARGKKSALRLVTAAALMAGGAAGTGAALAAPPLITPPALNQLPTGAQVASGSVSISQTQTATAASMAVQQSSNRAIVNWQSFNVGANAKVNITQPSTTSVLLNRVQSSDPSQIFGQINANGQVLLLNPNGVYFAPGSRVDVGSFTASTHSLSDADFLSDQYRFNRNGATGSILNEGHISAGLGGYIALLAPEVRNQGVVVAQVGGTVALAAGESFELQFNNQKQLTNVLVTPATLQALVENGQAVQAPGGLIILSAQAASGLLGGVVKNSGALSATGLVNDGGTIRLSASHKIELTPSSSISADAAPSSTGNGGRIDIITDLGNATGITQVDGSISAKGGEQGGDGGFVDTSAARLAIGETTLVTTGARMGNAGTWLLDPYDVTIAGPSDSASGTVYADSFTAAETSVILASSISNALNAGSNVTVSTGSASSNTIFVNSAIAATTGSASLTLTGGTINLAADITTIGSQTYNGVVVINNASGINLSSTNSPINFASTVNSATGNYYGLTVSNGTGTTAFGGVVGGTNPLGYLCINAASCNATAAGTASGNGATTLTGDVTTSGTQTYGGNLTLGANTELTSTANSGNGAVTIAGYVNTATAGSGYLYLEGLGYTNGTVTATGSLGVYLYGGNTYTLASGTSANLAIGTLTYNGVASNQSSYSFVPNSSFAANFLIVGGGGGGGVDANGGGGGGGVVTNAYNGGNALLSQVSLTASTSYNVLIGSGGAPNVNGYNSVAFSYTALGGGYGIAANGGSGGGRRGDAPAPGLGNSTQYATQGYGFGNAGGGAPGGQGWSSSGGGGAGGAGQKAISGGAAGAGGAAYMWVDGNYYAGGGGGAGDTAGLGGGTSVTAQKGGGGDGGFNNSSLGFAGTNGTGGGGGGAYCCYYGFGSGNRTSAGGSGVVSFSYNAYGNYALTINSGSGKSSIGGSVSNVTNLTVNSTSALSELTGAIGGSTALTKSGAGGALTLLGSNTFTGGTTISAGTLKTGHITALGGSGGAVSVASGAALDLNGTTLTNTNPLTLSGTGINSAGALTNSSSTAGTYAGNIVLGSDSSIGSEVGDIASSGVISGAFALTKVAAASLTLTGSNTYSGGTTIAAGTLQVGAGSTSGAISGDVTNNAILAFNRSDAHTYSGAISGTGSVNKLGTGTTTLLGVNTYSGGTTISTGTLQLGAGGTSGSIQGNVTNNATLGFNRSDAVTYAGVISGTGAVTKSAGNTLTFTGANTYTGGTTISAGTLQLGDGNTSGTIAGDVTNNATLAFNRGDDVTYAGVISGSGAVNKTGAGTTTLSGGNTFSGLTTINAGTLAISHVTGLGGSGTGTTVASGATLDLQGVTVGAEALALDGGTLVASTGTSSLLGAVSLGANSTVNVAGTQLALSGVVSGSGYGLTKTGAGSLVLSGTNTYSGATTISAGTLNAASGAALGTGAVSIGSSGVLDLTHSGTVSLGSTLSMSSGAAITNSANTSNLAVAGASTLVGNVNTAGNQTYTGAVTLSGDTTLTTLDTSQANTNGTITFGATVDGTASGAQSLVITSGTGAVSFGSTIGDTTPLSTLTITGGATYTGQTTTLGGNVTTTGNQTFGGNLTLGANTVLTSTANSGNGTVTIAGNVTSTLTAASGIIQFLGSGNWKYSTNNGSTWAYYSNSGSGNTYSSGSSTTLAQPSALPFSISYNGSTYTYTPASSIDNAEILVVGGGAAGGGSSAPATGGGGGGGVIYISNASLSGAYAVDVGSGGAGGNGNGGSGGNSRLSLVSNPTGYVITANGGGGGAGASGNSGIAGGSGGGGHWTTGNGGAATQGSVTGFTGATLSGNVGGASNRRETAGGGGGGALTAGSSGTGTTTSDGLGGNGGQGISYLISGADVVYGSGGGGMGYAGSGVGGANAGNAAIRNGVGPSAGAANTGSGGGGGVNTAGAGGTGVVILAGSLATSQGTYALTFNSGSGKASIGGSVSNVSTLTINSTSALSELTGAIGGSTALTKSGGGGALTLSGANTYTGGTTVSGGTVQLGSSSSMGFTSGPLGTGAVTLSGGRLNLNGQSIANDLVSTASTGSLGAIYNSNSTTPAVATGHLALGIDSNIGGSNDFTLSGTISGGFRLTKVGGSQITLLGGNTYSGGTTISEGTLQVGAGGTSGAIAGDVTNNAILAFNRSDAHTYSGAISGTGSVNKLGTGTTTLLGVNTYSGGTTISAGTLQLGAGGTAGSIQGNVTNNATLAFSRSDDLTFDGVISGTGAVTKLAANTLTFTGVNTYTGGTTISAGTLQLGDGNTSGTIAGDVTNNATLAFNRSDDVTYAGVISGTGALTKSGSGTLTLSGINTYSGSTTVSAGSLAISNAAGLGDAATGTTVASGATLDLQGVNVGAEDVTLNGGTLAASSGSSSLSGAVTLGAISALNVSGTQLTLSGAVTAPYGLALLGTGGVVLSKTANALSTIATGNLVGSLNLINGAALTIDQVSFGGTTYSGIDSTGTVAIATRSGDLTVLQSVRTSSMSSNTASPALLLSAGSATGAGTATGGEIVLGGSPTLEVGSGGIAAFYSGLATSGEGPTLTNALRLKPSNYVRYNQGSSDLPVSGPGYYALFRESPTVIYLLPVSGQSSVYGTAAPALSYCFSISASTCAYPSASGIPGAAQSFSLAGNALTSSISEPGGVSGNLLLSGPAAVSSGISATTAAGAYGLMLVPSLTLAGHVFYSGNAVNYTVDPKSINLAISKTYDGTNNFSNANSYTFTGMANGDSAPTLTGGSATTVSANVSVYNSLASNTLTISDGNYTVTGGALVATVNRASLSATLTGTSSKVYDGSTTATLATGNFALTGFVNSEGASVTQTSGTLDTANVGTSKTVAAALSSSDFAVNSGTQLSNYNLPTSASGSIGSVTPAPLSATLTGTSSKDYDGSTTATLATGNFALTGFVNSEGGSVTQTSGTLDTANVGTSKTVTAALSSSDFAANGGTQLSNYNLPTSASGSIGSVTPAPLSATLTGTSSKVYDGSTAATLVAGNFALTGFVNSEGASVSQTSGTLDTANVGTSKTVTAALSSSDFAVNSGTQLSNYNLPTSASGNMGSVTPASLTVSAINASKTYDGIAYSGGNGVSYSGFVNSETASVLGGTLNYTGTSQGARNAGSYVITPAGLTSSNYAVSFADGSLSVAPATLTVTAVTNTKSFDGNTEAQVLPVVTGLKVSDAVVNLREAYADANPGTGKTLSVQSGYQIVDGNNGNNYVVSLVPSQTGEIRSLPVAVLAPSLAVVPTGNSASPTLTVLASSSAGSAGSAGSGSSAGVSVSTISTPSQQMTGLVAVLVPAGTATAGIGLVIALPEQVMTPAATGASVQVTLPNSEPLPAWIRYDAASQTLVTSAVPTGAFPLSVVVTVGGQSTVVQISESQSNP